MKFSTRYKRFLILGVPALLWSQGICEEKIDNSLSNPSEIKNSKKKNEVTYTTISDTKQDSSICQPAILNSCCPCYPGPMIEAKAGYFFFASSKMRKIFDHGGVDVQLSGSYPLWRNLQVYGSIEYLQKSGRSLNGHQKTSIWQIPVNFGLKPIFTFWNHLQYYITLGPRYFYIHQHNESSYVPRNKGRSGVGLFANTGINYVFCNGFLLDAFGEYSFTRTRFHNAKHNVEGRRIQVGGFTFGLGIGFSF